MRSSAGARSDYTRLSTRGQGKPHRRTPGEAQREEMMSDERIE